MVVPAESRAAVPYRQIRASYDATTITVYQAYNREIASAAVAQQKINASPLFKLTRMTWIKASWAWMLYRAGYWYKDPGQERILALKMKHEDFIGLLEKAVLTFGHATPSRDHPHGNGGESRDEKAEQIPQTTEVGNSPMTEDQGPKARRHRDPATPQSPNVKVQWDPERTVRLGKLDYRSIQIGIPAGLSPEWTAEWIVSIEDVTERARELKRVLDERPDVSKAELVEMGLVPVERPFEVPEHLQRSLGMLDA